MFNLEVTTPAAGVAVTAAELRAWPRLNDPAEDAVLTDLIAAAAERFEEEAKRPVLSTGYRQYLSRWPWLVVLGRAGITAVAGVGQYLADGVTTAAVSTGWYAD